MENVEPKKTRARKIAESGAEETSKTKRVTKKEETTEEEVTPKWWNDGRLSKTTGLFLLLFSLVVFAAITSYFFTALDDRSEVANRTATALADGSVKVSNSMGRLGAVLAHVLVDKLFGFGSYIIGLLCFVTGFNLFFATIQFRLLKWLVYGFFALVFVSCLLAFLNFQILPDSVLSWGGGFGNYLTGSDGYLTGLVKPLGVGLILGAYLLIATIWIFNYDFGKLLVRTPKSEPLKTNNNVPFEAFKDEDENIFGKDKIITQDDVAFDLEDTITADEVVEKNEEDDDDLKMELVTPLSNTSARSATKNKTDDEELSLQVTEVAKEETGKTRGSIGTSFDPTQTLSGYQFPKLEFLDDHASEKVKYDPEELERNKNQIVATLNNYAIEISKIRATIGPTVTLYEIVPAPGVRISKIKNLEDDIALSLAALGIRIIAPIPGKGTIGIEVPNVNKEVVSMRSLLLSEKFQNTTADLPICLGKTIANEIIVADLAKMPHLLMAGATGQGKSVGINAILVSLLYKKHPSQLKFVMVDPKKVELSVYEKLEKHYLAKLPGEEDAIITDVKKVITTLNALCLEMDNRYELLKKAGVRNLKEYNHKFTSRQLNPQNGHQFLPYIVLVVDEFADLIMTAGKEVEMPIARLAQLARAIGIHLILATQRPSVNIITGTIKANFPARIAFKTTSKIDSRTILDTGGADQLIGRGDMLLSQGSDIIRLQCGFVDTPEVERIRDFISDQQGFDEAFLLPEYIDPKEKGNSLEDFGADGSLDEMFEDAARVIVQNQSGSTSLIQRRLKLGYNRAGRLMDQLESAGIVGENLGSKARDVIVKTEAELEQVLMRIREKGV